MIKVIYYYSACVGLKSKDVSILCDPWFNDGAFDGAWYQFPKIKDPLSVIGEYNYIFVSHIHPDHYDPIFLKSYLRKYPKTKIIIGNFKENFLSKRMSVDAIHHQIVEEYKVGKTLIKLILQNSSLVNIDCALVMTDGKTSVANMNDCEWDIEQLDTVKAISPGGTPTIALLPYTGAGPYPQTYSYDHKLMLKKASEIQKSFDSIYKKTVAYLKPKITIPFAGSYLLGGKLTRLNQYRCVIDPVHVLAFDEKAIVLADGGKEWIDTINLHPSKKRTKKYSEKELEARFLEIERQPMAYEKYFSVPVEALSLRPLLIKACINALKKSICEKDYYLCIKLDFDWFVMNVKKGNDKWSFEKDVSKWSPRSEILIDYRYLFGLLTMVFHWNNAEVGSQFMTRRYPDKYVREAQTFLNFFHI